MPLSVGTSAVRLAAFDGSGDQGSPHDVGWVWHCVEDFLTACFESVSGNGFVRVSNLISTIHDKIIPQGEEKVHPVALEKFIYTAVLLVQGEILWYQHQNSFLRKHSALCR